MLIPRTLLLALACLGSVVVAGAPVFGSQEGPLGRAPVEPAEPDPADQVSAELETRLLHEQQIHDSLYNRFANEMEGYWFEARKLRDARVPRSEFPASPVLTFYPLFEDLARDGNGAARLWLVRFSADIVEDKPEQGRFCKKYLQLLAEEHASALYMLQAVQYAKERRDLVGDEFLLQFYRRLQETSLRHQVQAHAYFAESELILSKTGHEDPANQARAQEIWQILVDGFSQSKPALFAGQRLFESNLRELRAALASWLAQIRELREQGLAPESWPPCPIGDFRGRVSAIAGTQHKVAQRWASTVFPAFDQAARKGVGPALAMLANWMTIEFSHTSRPWNELKFGLLDLLYTVAPHGEAVLETLESLEENVSTNLPDDYIPALERLVENTPEDSLRFAAKLCQGRILERGSTDEEFAKALELYAEVQRDAPLTEQRDRGRELGVELSWTMPGAVHPTISQKDADGVDCTTSDYGGRILLLYFWSQHVPGALEEIAWVNEFARRNADKGVAVLGINVDFNSTSSFRRKCEEFGITWRNILAITQKSYLALQFKVSRFPTPFVIDSEGIIRGRNQSHEEIDALVARLVAEREGATTALAVHGTLHGVARFHGPHEPLPDLVVTPEQAAECAADGRELDRTDRSRLVSADGGLANVVVTVESRGQELLGEGQSFVLEGRDCRFEPHVLQIPRGAKLELRNSDAVARQVRVKSAHNRSFATIVPPGGSYISDVKAADRFQVRSESHPWMSAWVVVTDTPFAVRSAPDGTFEIPDLPAGDYVASWWHESLGRGQTAEFSVKAGETTELEIIIEGKP
jgi:hypothetical protein